jgi:pimeloyl-ACP methyl ester carboxylesterase
MTVALAGMEYGQGAPLVVLHGLFGSGRNWASVARRLAARRRVLVPDLRNHGDSPWSDAMGYEDMATDVFAFIRARGLGRAALLGHSMGGKTAMLTALEHGDAVERLIVVDIAPVTYPVHWAAEIEEMRALDLEVIARRADADRLLSARIPDGALRAFLLQNLVFEAGKAHWRLNLPAIERAMPRLGGFPARAAAAPFAGPALFIAGDRSDYVRAAHETAILSYFPSATISRIEGAGHWVHAEQPEAFVRAVERFLDDR